MISWGWRQCLSDDELSDVGGLLAAAAAYDEQAGFSTATPRAPAQGVVRHLLVTMPPRGARGSAKLDRLPDVRVVAYLRVDVVGATGDVQFVVHPEFRSLGIATLLVERLAVEHDGWTAVPELRMVNAWSHGAHPAAERMKMRLGANVTAAVIKTLRPVGGSRPLRGDSSGVVEAAGGEVPELVANHHLALTPADQAVLCRAAATLSLTGVPGGVVVGSDPDQPDRTLACLALLRHGAAAREELAQLLLQGLLVLQRDGARMVQCYLDALDDEVVAVSRSLGFEHDQSDLRYELNLSG